MCHSTGTPRNTIVYSSAIEACAKGREWYVVPPRCVSRRAGERFRLCVHGRWWALGRWAGTTQEGRGGASGVIAEGRAMPPLTPRHRPATPIGRELALDLLRRMYEDGIPADTTVLNSALSACARAGEVVEAKKLFEHEVAAARLTLARMLLVLARLLARILLLVPLLAQMLVRLLTPALAPACTLSRQCLNVWHARCRGSLHALSSSQIESPTMHCSPPTRAPPEGPYPCK